MKFMSLLTLIGAVIFIAAAVIFPIAMGARGITPGMVFLDAFITSQLAMVLSVILAVVAVIVGLSAGSAARPFLKVLGWTALGIGLLVILHLTLTTMMIVKQLGYSGLRVLAPTILEGLYVGACVCLAAFAAFAFSARVARKTA